MRVAMHGIVSSAAVVLLFLVPSAWGDTKTFDPASGGTGNWSDGNDWSPTGVPTDDDHAIIPAGKLCNVDTSDAVADTVEVYGTLLILSGGLLKLHGQHASESTVDGDGEIQISDGFLHFIANPHVLSGTGAIVGSGTGGIRIGPDKTLTNRLATSGKGIRATLTIDCSDELGTATLLNEGIVEATGHSVLVLEGNLVLDDISSADWIADGCRGQLKFRREALGLVGQFLSAGVGNLVFEADVTTCGTYTNDLAGYSFNNTGSVFKYALYDDAGCANDGTLTDPTNDPGCNNPWIADSDYACAACAICYADCDANGALNIDDFICFQLQFALQNPYADCDGNQVFNIDDFICFQLAFALGC